MSETIILVDEKTIPSDMKTRQEHTVMEAGYTELSPFSS